MRLGFFDSGIGGVAVARAYIYNHPEFEYVYCADDAHMPYGNKSPDDVFELTTRSLTILFRNHCALVILACNSASAVLPRIQQEWLPRHYPDRRVLGVIRPTTEDIVERGHTHPVYILATPLTVTSRSFDKELNKMQKGAVFQEIACPGLAEAIEYSPDLTQDERVWANCQSCVASIPEHVASYLYTACTHYEWVGPLLQKLRPNATLVHQSGIIAEKLSLYLSHHTEIEKSLTRSSHSALEIVCSSSSTAYMRKLRNLFHL